MDNETLVTTLQRHADQESEVLDRYRTLSAKLGEGPVGMLVDMILTDEEMHHLVLHTTAKWLNEPSAGASDAGLDGADRGALLQLTRELRHHEQETIDEFSALQSDLPAESGAFVACLVQTMILDSEKHHRLLGLVENLLED